VTEDRKEQGKSVRDARSVAIREASTFADLACVSEPRQNDAGQTKTITSGTPASLAGNNGAYRANQAVLPSLGKKSEDS
jgi:hypothetical protein